MKHYLRKTKVKKVKTKISGVEGKGYLDSMLFCEMFSR